MAFVVYIGPHDRVEVRFPGELATVDVEREKESVECADEVAANLVEGGDWRYRQAGEESKPVDDGQAETPADGKVDA